MNDEHMRPLSHIHACARARKPHPTPRNLYRNEKLLQDPTRLRQISERIPAGRWGEPRDFAGPVVFLASAASMYINGEILVVDGVSLPLPISLLYSSPHLTSSVSQGWMGR